MNKTNFPPENYPLLFFLTSPFSLCLYLLFFFLLFFFIFYFFYFYFYILPFPPPSPLSTLFNRYCGQLLHYLSTSFYYRLGDKAVLLLTKLPHILNRHFEIINTNLNFHFLHTLLELFMMDSATKRRTSNKIYQKTKLFIKTK